MNFLQRMFPRVQSTLRNRMITDFSLKPYPAQWSDISIRHLLFIRYDLPWESHYARDIAGERSGPPEAFVGTENEFWNRILEPEEAITNMTFADTYVVDLSAPEEKILQAMKPKTRYNIRLAKKRRTNYSLRRLRCCPHLRPVPEDSGTKWFLPVR